MKKKNIQNFKTLMTVPFIFYFLVCVNLIHYKLTGKEAKACHSKM